MKLFQTLRSPKHKQSRGFTLTELAIVLGIISVVAGGIWTAYAAVARNRTSNDLVRNIVLIADNAHKIYSGQNSSDVDDLVMQVNANLFPANFLSSNTITSPAGLPGIYGKVLTTIEGYYYWGGYYSVDVMNGNPAMANVYVFEVDLVNIPDDICARIVTQMMGNGQVMDIETPNNGWGPVYNGSAFGANSSSTMLRNIPISQVTQGCNSGGTGNSYVWTIFSFQ